jgi:hypothetical protein
VWLLELFYLIHVSRCKSDSNYSVEISVRKREDIELLLGVDSLAPKYINDISNDRTEVLCCDLFPMKLKYFTSHSMLVVGIDYETRVEKLNKKNLKFLGYSKPGDHKQKKSKNSKKLKARNRIIKEEFENIGIDHENILEKANSDWFDNSKFNESLANIRPKRIKTKCM